MRESFIQFYCPSRFQDYTDLGNGLSDTLDYCKERGNVHWVEQRGPEWATPYKMLVNKIDKDKFYNLELPEESDIVYISAIYSSHLYQAYVWAKKYPKIKFVAGGPAIRVDVFKLTKELPENLTLTDKSVEEYFGIENFSYKWKLEPPDINDNLIFCYAIDEKCYWNKCVYCNYVTCRSRVREKIDFEFKDLKSNGHRFVRINTASTTPKQIKELVPRFPKSTKNRYDLYMRFGRSELEAFKIADIGESRIKLTCGVEYPSDRMLKFMNKGVTKEEIFNMTKFLGQKGNIEATIFIILGWEELEYKDLTDLKKYLDIVPENFTIFINNLFVKPYTSLFDRYQPTMEEHIGPFFLGYIPKLSKEKKRLNLMARDLILKYKERKIVDWSRGIL